MLMKFHSFIIHIIIYIFFNILNIFSANSMILDEKYSKNSDETVLKILNINIDKSYSISLSATQNLEDTKNISIQINKLKNIIHNDLIIIIDKMNNSSNANKKIINAITNINILINSINDKIDMILGGASPIAIAFYSEEIVSIFDKIYNGIDKNNNNIIEFNLGEGCLNYLNSISENKK